VLVYPDTGKYAPVDSRPDTQARRKAYEVFEKLAHLDAGEFGATAEYEGEVPGIRFSPGAQEIFDAWRSEVEPRYRSGGYPAALEAHVLKYRSLFASLALIFEAIDFVSGKEGSGGQVSRENAMRAAGWCSYLESHVHRVYSPLMDTPEQKARILLDHLLVGEIKHGAKGRDIQRKGWRGLRSSEDLRVALDILEELGWVRRVNVQSPGRGRGSIQLHLHPDLRD
jgi:hypothetical protein